MRAHVVVRTIGAALAIATVTLPAAHGAPPTAALTSRIATPGPDIIGHFEAAGMRSVRPYVLKPAELAQVEQAVARLPALHRRVLETHLRHLGFVEGVPGQGTALTSKVGDTMQFDITVRASALHESLAEFLTTKERRLYEADGSAQSVTFETDGADALSYLLLHEVTHVLDMSRQLTDRPGNAFGSGIWTPARDDGFALAPQLAASPIAASRFRGAGLIPAGRARITYDALATSPFVSLYATAAPAEDLAELMAWHVVSRDHGHKIWLTVRAADGALLGRYEPMQFPGVRARLPLLDQLLGEAEPDAS